MKLKVLTEEIEKMGGIIEGQNGKISDLEYFIQKMLEDNEENRILAKQILIE